MTQIKLVYLIITFILFLRRKTSNFDSLISTVDFSPSIVCSYLDSLDVSKACGPDLIPAFYLDAVQRKSLLHFLICLINLWTQVHFPGIGFVPMLHWLLSAITDIPSNYRPISLTSIVVKTVEYIIHSKLTSVLESYNLVNVHQFGFCKHHSTTHLLLEAVHDSATALECWIAAIVCVWIC